MLLETGWLLVVVVSTLLVEYEAIVLAVLVLLALPQLKEMEGTAKEQVGLGLLGCEG